jgi:adenylyltransferase/sulfurtransferase
MNTSQFTADEIRRYSRHLVLPELGIEGQTRLKQSSALIIGVGGLGSPLALYLAAAGVGHLGLLDFDVVDESNLQRQIVHTTATIGIAKTESARQRLHDLNPYIEITTHQARLTTDNALALLQPYDVIIDATDTFQARYLINETCVTLGKSHVYGSIHRFEGQCTVFAVNQGGPCYRCLYPQPPPLALVPSCAEAGVAGILPGLIGTIQATETIKLLTGIGTPLIGRLLLYDALAMDIRQVTLRPTPDCPCCGILP